MPYRLRDDGVGRYVDILPNSEGNLWVVPSGIDPRPFGEQINALVECIETGSPIPEWYYSRNDKGDRLYEEKGWFHLHVGHGIDDNVLLIVEEEVEGVLVIALTDHSIFSESPKAGRLRKYTGGALAKRRLKIAAYRAQRKSSKTSKRSQLSNTSK